MNITQVKSRQRANVRAGFTLIEFTAALALMIVICGLLPAVQRLRESYNQQAIDQHLRTVAAKLIQQHQAAGKFPASLEEAMPASFGITPADRKAGYQLAAVELSPNRVRLAAEPIPGVTGSMTGMLEVGVSSGRAYTALNFTKTPGADEGRRQMFDETFASAARAIGRLVGLVSSTDQAAALKRIKEESENPLRQGQVFNSVRNRDGKVTFASIIDHLAEPVATTSNPSAKAILSEVAQDFHRSLRLGALGEQVNLLPGISTVPVVPTTDRLLTFPRLKQLTEMLIDQPVLEAALLQFVADAEAADARGDDNARQKALAGYIGKLADDQVRHFSWGESGGSGANLFAPFQSGETLIPLATALQ
ncbi:MAG: type II secretion system protein [Bryobacteraceae bacterium]